MNTEIPIELYLSERYGKVVAPKGLLNWVTREVDSWIIPDVTEGFSGDAANRIDTLRNMFKRMRRDAERYEQADDRDEKAALLLNFQTNLINDIEHSMQFIPSSTPQGKICCELWNMNPEFGYAAFIYFNNQNLSQPSRPGHLVGLILAAHYSSDYFNRNMKLADSAQQLLEDINEISAMASRAHAQSIAENRLNSKAYLDEHKEFVSKARRRLVGEIRTHRLTIKNERAEMDNLRDTYHNRLALEGPLEYWGKQQKKHGLFATLFFVSFVLLLISGGLAIIWLSVEILQAHGANGDALTGLGKFLISEQMMLERITTVGLLFTLFAWLLRVISRLMMSNSHRAADAGERKTMIQTFLALLEKGDAIDESDRHLVLKAVFRPGSTGLIKGDAIPSQLVNIMSGKAES